MREPVQQGRHRGRRRRADVRRRTIPRRGDWVTLRAEVDLLVVLSTAPHPLDPSWSPARRARRGRHRPMPVGADDPQPHLPRGVGARARCSARRCSHDGDGAPVAHKSLLDPRRRALDKVVATGRRVPAVASRRAAEFRIVDLERQPGRGHAFLRRADCANRYSAFDTIREQGGVYLTTGSRLLSASARHARRRSRPTPAAGTTPIGGACSQESNVIRYGSTPGTSTPAGETFLRYGAECGIGPAELAPQHQFLHERPGDARTAGSPSKTG